MKFFSAVFLVLIGLYACDGEQPASDKVLDTPEDDLVLADTGDIRIDTIVTADGKIEIVTHDCSVLRKKIPSDSALEQLQYDLDELSFCVDSFDFRYVVPNLLASWLSEERVKGTPGITYGDFVKHLDEFKTTASYAELHDRVMTLDSVRSLPFDVNKIAQMQATFGKLGMTQGEWNAFSGFARTYPVPQKAQTVFTWGEMMDAFDTYYGEYESKNP